MITLGTAGSKLVNVATSTPDSSASEKRDRLRIVRPPEAVVVVVEDLLPVDEREDAVQDRRPSVGGQTSFALRGEIHHPEVVVPSERDAASVGGEARVDLGRRGSRQTREAGTGQVEEIEIAAELVETEPARGVERDGPGESLRRFPAFLSRFEAGERRGTVHDRPAHAADRIQPLERALRRRSPLVEEEDGVVRCPRVLGQACDLIALRAGDPVDRQCARRLRRDRLFRRCRGERKRGERDEDRNDRSLHKCSFQNSSIFSARCLSAALLVNPCFCIG